MVSDQELAEADREFEAINQPMTEEEKAHWGKSRGGIWVKLDQRASSVPP